MYDPARPEPSQRDRVIVGRAVGDGYYDVHRNPLALDRLTRRVDLDATRAGIESVARINRTAGLEQLDQFRALICDSGTVLAVLTPDAEHANER